jgi:hypothetical protein
MQRSGGTWVSLRHRGYQMMRGLSHLTERFWLSRWYFPLMLALASAFALAGEPVYGAAALLCAATWFLLFSSDLLSAVCPFAMTFLMAGPEYENLSVFLPCAFLVVPFFTALVLHLAIWPVTLRMGRSGYGLGLVSLATLLGGCDVMRRSQMLAPLSLYYTLGLGVVMLGLYVLFRSSLRGERSYDPYRRFAAIFYVLGLLMAVVVFSSYIWRWDEVLSGGVLYLKYRNFAATIFLTSFPVSAYFALRDKRSLLGGLVLLGAMVLTGSRSALLFGVVEVVLVCLYLVHYGAVSRRTMLILAALAAVAAVAFGGDVFRTVYANRLVNGHLITGGESRWRLLARGVSDFLHHPLFGMGLGNTANRDLFTGVGGSMFFYHNAPLQVLGSMGLLGMVAYGRLIMDRFALLRAERTPFTSVMALSYLGMLMVSMTNPGEFCPFPNEGLMVMLFAVLEEATGDVALPVPQLLGIQRISHQFRRRDWLTFVHE